MRTLTGIAAALTGLVGAVLHAVNTSAGRGIEPSFWLLSALGAVAFGCTGAVLARQGTVLVVPTVLALIGLGQGVSLVAREYALAGAFPLDGFALWVGSWLWAPAYLAIAALLPLLLPDGQLPSPRWRPALVLSVVALLGQAVVWAVTPYALQDVPFDVRGLTNPVGVAAAAEPVVIATAGVLTALAVLLALASVVARWRAAAGERRQQLKWLGVGAAATVLLFVIGLVLPNPAGELVAATAVLPVPVCAAIAAMRHRLWDVDFVVSLGLRYAILSAIVVAAYATVVSLLGATTGAPVVATAVVAVLLVPAHGQVQRWVNEWVHGEADDPGRALARLGERLETTAEPGDIADRLLPEVVARLASLLRASYVAVELVDGGSAEDGVRPEQLDRIPLQYAGAPVGALLITHRDRSRGEQRRLDELARQASVAVHSVLLARDARRSRQLVVAAREEERRRLRRDLHDGVGPVIAALALQAETARDLVAARPDEAARLLDTLVPRLNDAVADVRALVHELRPPTLDELGLAGAVRELAARFDAPGLTVRTETGELGELPAAVELAAYRFVAEGVANAVRHADPRTVVVTVSRGTGWLQVEVRDDGSGIAADAVPGVGLASMRQRAEELGGRFEQTGLPRGTVVAAQLPLTLEGIVVDRVSNGAEAGWR